MSRKVIHTLICVFLFPFILNAQEVNVQGAVTDISTDEPLFGASIVFKNLNSPDNGITGSTSNLSGDFNVSLESGQYEVSCSYIGYKTNIDTFDIRGDMKLYIKMNEATTLLEAATVTASKYRQKFAEATVSIDVIKPKLVENSNGVSVDATLQKVPGVQIVDQQANIRGGSGYSFGAGSRVLLLIDDIPALQADAGLPNWNDVPTENLAQIEVVKGAASALYGSAAMNGIINVRTGFAGSTPETKAGVYYTHFFSPADSDKKWWTDAPYAIGGHLLHKRKFKNDDLVVGGFYYRLNSFNEDFRERRGRVNLKWRHRVGDRISFGINSTLNKANNSSFFFWLDPGPGAMRADPGTISLTDNTRFIIDPYLTIYDKNDNRHRIQGRFYGIDNDNNLNQSNQSNLYYTEYQFQTRMDPKKLILTTGVVSTFTRSNSPVFGDTIIRSTNLAVYAQLDKQFGKRLNASLGVRYEYNEMLGPQMIDTFSVAEGSVKESKPIIRAGMSYQLGKYSFLRGSFGQGYRFPTIAEKYISTTFGSGANVLPNPLIESETGWSSELGLKQGFKFFGWEGYIDAALFWSQYNNMIEFQFDGVAPAVGIQAENVGDTDIKGFEVSIMGQSELFGIPVSFIGGYTFINPVFRNFTQEIQSASSVDFNILKYRTKHNMKFDVEAEGEKVLFGLAMQRASHMVAIDQTFSFINGIGNYRNFNNTGFYLFDARAGYKIGSMKFTLLLNNIFNEEYTLRPGKIEAPRNISFRYDVKF